MKNNFIVRPIHFGMWEDDSDEGRKLKSVGERYDKQPEPAQLTVKLTAQLTVQLIVQLNRVSGVLKVSSFRGCISL